MAFDQHRSLKKLAIKDYIKKSETLRMAMKKLLGSTKFSMDCKEV